MTGPVLAGALVGFIAAQGVKTQGVRLFDVLALGPYLITLGRRQKLTDVGRAALLFAGAATIGYNARNLLENLRK